MKVLVVDDSRSDRKVIRYNLEWHGCQVVEASNGRQGVELAAGEKPDLIISDCLMPITDGFEFLHELRKRTETKTIPFIFYSAAYTGSKEVELAFTLGAQAFLEKPKSPEELWEEVGRVLAAHSAGETAGTVNAAREDEALKNYSRVVAGELEEKVRGLTEMNESLLRLNAELEQRVVERTVRLEAANHELETFAYSISHDLRAPLRHIDGFSQALYDDYAPKLNTTGREYLERIRKSTLRIMEMIDGLLQLSRYGRATVAKESVDLSAIANEIGAELARSNPDRKVKLEVAEGVVAHGDSRLLRAVLQQLLENAWKFTAPKEEAVIEFYSTDWEGRVAFAVRDNGVGFDMGYSEKLFAPFQRLHSQLEFPGIGMGLAIVKKIISLQGGKVRAEAEPGRGATVTFTL